MKTPHVLPVITTLIMGATLNAAVLNVTKEGGTDSSAFGSMLAPGATLINTGTQGVIIYDENMIPPLSAPFDLSHGVGYKGFTLSGSLPTTGETLFRKQKRLSYP